MDKKTDKMTVYIAGPMSHIPDYNFPAFDEAQEKLESQGYNVLNPAQMDRDSGFDPLKDKFEGQIKEDVIRRDLDAIMSVDGIVLLPGWEKSTGACAELGIANWRGIQVFFYPSMHPAASNFRQTAHKTIDQPAPGAEKSGLKDSGERRAFESGSVRDTSTGKGSPSLLPILALTKVSQHFEKGAIKYAARNWEKGQPFSAFYDSGYRHLMKFWGGATDEDHLTAYAWNALCLLETFLRVEREILPAELDDRGECLCDENGEV